MEDTIIFGERIYGRKAEVGYWSGAAFSGMMLAFVLDPLMKLFAAAIGGDDDDDEATIYEKMENGTLVKWFYKTLSGTGAYQLAGPLFDLAAVATGAADITQERLAVSLHGGLLPLGQAAGIAVASGKAMRRIREEELGVLESMEAMARAALAGLAGFIPAVRQAGFEEEVQDFGKGE